MVSCRSRSESADSYSTDASFTTAWSSIPSEDGKEDEEEFTDDLYVEVEKLLIDIKRDRVAKAGNTKRIGCLAYKR